MNYLSKVLVLIGLVLFGFISPGHAAKRAVLVGIGDYPDVNKLIGPQHDAENMQKLLQESLGFQSSDIKMLIDADASRDGILQTLESWLVEGTEKDDQVVFYFSGHGFQTADLNGDEKDQKDEALAAYDVKLENGAVVNMITDDEIESIFAKLDDRFVTIIVDSCHSGTMTRGLPSASNQQHEKTLQDFNNLANTSLTKSMIQSHREEKSFVGNSENRVVWTAVSSWQKALVDFERKNGSVFTNQFISGIGEKKADFNHNGIVSRVELLEYIRSESEDFCDRNRQNCRSGLTPTLEAAKDLYIEDASSLTFQREPVPVTEVASTNAVVQTTETAPIKISQSDASIAQYFSQMLVKRDENQLEMEIYPEGAQYPVGTRLKFRVRSPFDGYLVILDINEQGDVTQIFPNRYSDAKNKNGQILANQLLELPDKEIYGFDFFEAQPPVGKGRLIAIVTEDQVLPEAVSLNKDLVVIDEPKVYIQNVVQSLTQVWSDDESNRAVAWQTKSFDYSIVQ